MKNKYKNIRNKIKKLLVAKGTYESTDDTLLDEFIFWLKLGDEAKDNIEQFGMMVNVVRDVTKEPLYQTNQAVSVAKESTTKVAMLLTKLGITPQERNKLKNEIVDNNTEFDREFN